MRRPETRPWLLVYSIAITVLFLVTLTFVLAFQRSFHSDCVQRQRYDATSQHTRRAFRAYYVQQQQLEQTNQFIDDALRRERIAAAQTLIDSLDATLAATVHSNCG